MLAQPGAGSARPRCRGDRDTGRRGARPGWWARQGAGRGWRYGTPPRRSPDAASRPAAPMRALTSRPGRRIATRCRACPTWPRWAAKRLKRERRIGVPRPPRGRRPTPPSAALLGPGPPRMRCPSPSYRSTMRLCCRWAERLTDDGVLLEIMPDQWTAAPAGRTGALEARLAAVTRRAWRIHAVPAGNARDVSR